MTNQQIYLMSLIKAADSAVKVPDMTSGQKAINKIRDSRHKAVEKAHGKLVGEHQKTLAENAKLKQEVEASTAQAQSAQAQATQAQDMAANPPGSPTPPPSQPPYQGMAQSPESGQEEQASSGSGPTLG